MSAARLPLGQPVTFDWWDQLTRGDENTRPGDLHGDFRRGWRVFRQRFGHTIAPRPMTGVVTGYRSLRNGVTRVYGHDEPSVFLADGTVPAVLVVVDLNTNPLRLRPEDVTAVTS